MLAGVKDNHYVCPKYLFLCLYGKHLKKLKDVEDLKSSPSAERSLIKLY